MDDKNMRGHAAMLSANIIFGLNIPISKTILMQGQVSPFALTFYRMAGAAVLFWTISFFTKKERVKGKDLLGLFFASLFGIQLNQVMFIIGLSKTSPIDASVIATLVPILTMVMAAIFLREPVTWKKVLGVLIGASGALILVLGHASAVTTNGSEASALGNMLCVLSTVSFATYLSVFRGLISRYNPVTLMKWMFLFAAVCCSPICFSDVSVVDYAALPVDMYFRIAYVVVGATFLSYFLIPIGQRYLRPTIVSMYNYVQPLVSSLIAVAFGLDVFGWGKAAAALLVFTGVYLVTLSKSRAQMDIEKRSSN